MKNALFIVGALFLATLTASKIRGIRNNNWLNIMDDPRNAWEGMIGVDSKGFVIFSHPIYSLRAGFRILASYKNRGITSLYSILHTFAPPEKNPTASYIKTVSQLTGISPNIALQPSQWPQVLQAMAKVEVKKTPSIAELLKAQAMAFR